MNISNPLDLLLRNFNSESERQFSKHEVKFLNIQGSWNGGAILKVWIEKFPSLRTKSRTLKDMIILDFQLKVGNIFLSILNI